MNVNELRAKYLQAAEQEQAALQAFREALPKHEMQHGVFVSPHPAGVKIGYGTTGAEMGYTNAHAEFISDRLLAAYPIDPAPDAGWVSVEERLPKSSDDKVLVYTASGFQHTARYKMFQWRDLVRSDELPITVTHWRELPAPPANEGSKT